MANASRHARVTSSRAASHVSAGPLIGCHFAVLKRRVRRSSDEAPATCVMPSSRSDPFEPNTWKLKPGPVAVIVPEIPRRAVLHPEQHRRRVVAVDLHDTAEALTEHLVDLAAEIDHPVDRVHAHRRQAAARRLLAIRAPRFRLQQQRIRKRHRRFEVQDGPELAAT